MRGLLYSKPCTASPCSTVLIQCQCDHANTVHAMELVNLWWHQERRHHSPLVTGDAVLSAGLLCLHCPRACFRSLCWMQPTSPASCSMCWCYQAPVPKTSTHCGHSCCGDRSAQQVLMQPWALAPPLLRHQTPALWAATTAAQAALAAAGAGLSATPPPAATTAAAVLPLLRQGSGPTHQLLPQQQQLVSPGG